VFAAKAGQARVARVYIKQLNASHDFGKPIATKVSVGKKFFPAEGYHQNYAKKHPHSPYIEINDEPKVQALKHRFPKRYTARFIEGSKIASADSGA
jgi:peptide-methionine (S)-S-oxide reductase